MTQKYMSAQFTKEAKKEMNLKDFDNEKVCSPAKLLVYHLLNKPIKQELIKKSIDYFRVCSPEEKEGAFSILYGVMNPFELT